MLDQEIILNFIKSVGPTLPSKVAKIIKTDILLASAHLADLVSQGKVKISNLKVGGSPLYYLLGQEEQLYPFATGNVNPKDHRVLEILKSNRVLREEDLDLLSKVALRSLKDFAVPLRVTVNDKKEIFWKWHLLDENETNTIIRKILTPPQPITREASPEEIELKKEFENKSIKEADGELEEPKVVKPKSRARLSIRKTFNKEKQKRLSEKTNKKEEIINGQSNFSTVNKLSLVNEVDLDKSKRLKESKEKERSTISENELFDKNIDKSIVNPGDLDKEENKEVKTSGKKRVSSPDNFLPTIKEFLNSFEINIEQEEIIRKNSEIDLILEVPVAIGKLTYYCKAKSKKKCDEKDLSSAYMEAQIKKLPLLFLYSNDLNKKAQDMLDSGAFQNVTVKKID